MKNTFLNFNFFLTCVYYNFNEGNRNNSVMIKFISFNIEYKYRNDDDFLWYNVLMFPHPHIS